MSLPIVIDMRSDTVTKPTKSMQAAMAGAQLGDDVFGDDPTINELQDMTAKLLGKEAGLFVPSGTMANLIAVLVHCDTRDSEVILGDKCHIHLYEQGGIASLGGVHSRTVTTLPDGTFDLKEVESKIRGDDVHYPVTKLICLENTHNACGGRVLTAEYTDQVGQLAAKYGLKVHIDGARLMNAAVKLGVEPAVLVKSAQSVSLCLSKGLGSPVGSVLVGDQLFVDKARRLRKRLGGGMRQAGVLAACGIISLKEMVGRLSEDHDNAAFLAQEISRIPGIKVDLASVESNLLYFELESALSDKISGAQLVQALAKIDTKSHSADESKEDPTATITNSGHDSISVLCTVSGNRLRWVMHYHITQQHCQLALAKLQRIVEQAHQA